MTDPDPDTSSAPRVRRTGARPRHTQDPLLPDTTSDERDIGWGDPADPDDDDRLLREVPPHHGT